MNGGAWWATVHGVTKSQTRLSNFTFFHFHLLQYPGLENSMDRGAWRVSVHRVTKSQTRLSNLVHNTPPVLLSSDLIILDLVYYNSFNTGLPASYLTLFQSAARRGALSITM